jgi:hypothetical protein
MTPKTATKQWLGEAFTQGSKKKHAPLAREGEISPTTKLINPKLKSLVFFLSATDRFQFLCKWKFFLKKNR